MADVLKICANRLRRASPTRTIFIVVAILAIRLDIRPNNLLQLTGKRHAVGLLHQPYLDSTREAESSIRYLHLIQKNRAYIAPVVERRADLRQLGACRRLKPVFHQGDDWIENGQVYVYSAYHDGRENSLYPGLHAIQVYCTTGWARKSGTWSGFQETFQKNLF